MRLKNYYKGLKGEDLRKAIDKKVENRMKHKLVKQRGKTKDNRGTEFDYIVYKTMELGKTIEAKYVDDMGFNLEADSLKELKDKVSKIG